MMDMQMERKARIEKAASQYQAWEKRASALRAEFPRMSLAEKMAHFHELCPPGSPCHQRHG
jgi:hypothetical protein